MKKKMYKICYAIQKSLTNMSWLLEVATHHKEIKYLV
jgi:hypothetical protein